MPVPRTEDFAVKFGRSPDMGLEGQKAFPFIYTFVNSVDDPWLPNVGPAVNLSCLGPFIPAGAGTAGRPPFTINVRLDPDYNFKLLSIRYSAYKYVGGIPGIPIYAWYRVTNEAQEGYDEDMGKVGTPLIRYISMTLSFQGSGSVTLYGGPNVGALGTTRTPLPMESVQGFEYGFLCARTPYLLPMQGIMAFDITNSCDYDVVVAAAIYGMKIRV